MQNALGFNALAFALVLVSGYLVHEVHWWRGRAREYAGYILYFRVAILGIMSVIVVLTLHRMLPTLKPPWMIFPGNERINFLLVVFLLALALNMLSKATHVFYADKKLALRAELRRLENAQKFLEAHIFRVMMDSAKLMVTMDSGKVYVGSVFRSSAESGGKWLRLYPTLSGQRNPQTGEVNFTQNYAILQGGRATTDAFLVTLSIDKIVSVQNFDIDLYNEAFASENELLS